MRTILVLVVFYVLFPEPAGAQGHAYDSLLTPGYALTVRGHAGFIISHRESMSHLVKGHVAGMEIHVDRQTSGVQPWHHIFNRPSAGLGLTYLALGNPENLGSGAALYAYLDFPLVKRKGFIFHYKWGTGLGYVTKPYDRVDNYKNTAIGSALNLFANVLFETRFKISKHYWVTCGLDFNHWSNSSIAVPNLGINVPTLTLGIQGSFLDYSPVLEKEKASDLPRTMEYTVFLAPGLREIHPVEGRLYGVLHASAEAARRMDNRRKLGLGLDVFYDDSNLEEYNRDTSNTPIPNGMKLVKYGLHLSHELVFGRFSAMVHMGVYLKNNFKADGPIYHHFSYRYYLNEHIFIDAGFKSHWAVAENFETGVGYRFK